MSNRREENYFERKEEERQTRQDHWRVMAGMTDFFAVVIGVAVCLILVMLIEKPGKKAEPAGADTVFSVGDKLTVFGDYAVICRTFHARERFADTANGE